jgi:ABC-type lipoprotein release transport system permease subunit
MLIADHLRPAASGIALGLAGSWWTKEVMRRFLYQLEPGDPRIWAAASGLILVVVTLAAWLPARRAAATDPAMVLRAE